MMSFFSDPTDPKYDTVFSLLKFASATLTFSAGVIGIYSDRTLKNMKPTRLGWTLIALLFLGATSSFWTEWRQERASSAYAAKESERLRYLALASDSLLHDTTRIKKNAADELSAIKLTVKKVGKLSDNADETIKRVRKTDDDTLNAVHAARSTENRSVDLVKQNSQALLAIRQVEGQDASTLTGIAKLDAQTGTLNHGSQKILQNVHAAIKDVRRGLFPLFGERALQLSFWLEVDPLTAGAVTTRFQDLIAAYYADCPQQVDGRVMYDDSEFTFQKGKLVTVNALRLSPAYPSKDEWGGLFSPAELDISVWLGTDRNANLASSDLDMKVHIPSDTDSLSPSTLMYFVDQKRIGIAVGPMVPVFEPANLDIVGIEDLYGAHMVTQLKPSGTDVVPRAAHLGELSFIEGPERFAFNASNTNGFANDTGYQVDLPRDEATFLKLFSAHVSPTQALAPCTGQVNRVISSATKP